MISIGKRVGKAGVATTPSTAPGTPTKSRAVKALPKSVATKLATNGSRSAAASVPTSAAVSDASSSSEVEEIEGEDEKKAREEREQEVKKVWAERKAMGRELGKRWRELTAGCVPLLFSSIFLYFVSLLFIVRQLFPYPGVHLFIATRRVLFILVSGLHFHSLSILY